MIELVLIALVVFVIIYWWMSPSTPMAAGGLVLQQNGFYQLDSRGLAPKNIAVSLELKTRMPGIVFLFGGKGSSTQTEFATLRISIDSAGGRLSVIRESVSSESVYATITSPNPVMDGRWHSVAFGIDGNVATLVIDGVPLTANWPIAFDMASDVAELGGSADVRDDNLYAGCFRNVTFGSLRQFAFQFVPSERATRLGVTAPDSACC